MWGPPSGKETLGLQSLSWRRQQIWDPWEGCRDWVWPPFLTKSLRPAPFPPIKARPGWPPIKPLALLDWVKSISPHLQVSVELSPGVCLELFLLFGVFSVSQDWIILIPQWQPAFQGWGPQKRSTSALSRSTAWSWQGGHTTTRCQKNHTKTFQKLQLWKLDKELGTHRGNDFSSKVHRQQDPLLCYTTVQLFPARLWYYQTRMCVCCTAANRQSHQPFPHPAPSHLQVLWLKSKPFLALPCTPHTPRVGLSSAVTQPSLPVPQAQRNNNVSANLMKQKIGSPRCSLKTEQEISFSAGLAFLQRMMHSKPICSDSAFPQQNFEESSVLLFHLSHEFQVLCHPNSGYKNSLS